MYTTRTSRVAERVWGNGRQQAVGHRVVISNIRGEGMSAVGEAVIQGRTVACYRKHGSRTEWVTYMAASVRFNS